MKNFLCRISLHNYVYYTEIHKCESDILKHIKELSVPIRECKRCNKRDHHMMPRLNGGYYNWKEFKFKPEDKLFLK